MNAISLRGLVDFASRTAGSIFAHQGYFAPMWHAILPNGEHKIILQTIDDKDMQVALVRAAFELFDVPAYVFISEAWTLRADCSEAEMVAALEKYKRSGIRQDPNRVEALWIQAEDHTGILTASRRIIRPIKGAPHLGPLEVDEMSGWRGEGRMVSLLPRPASAKMQ